MTASERLALLAELWKKERAAAQARVVEARRNLTLAERVQRGIAARGLVVDETDAAPGGRVLLWLLPRRADELDDLRIGTGDPVRLWREDPDGEDAILGVVSRRRETRLAVVVDEGEDVFGEDAEFNLDRDEPLATFDRGDRAIARFRDAKANTDEARMRDVLLGDRAPRFEPAPGMLFPKDAALNEPQREAAARALAAKDVALIHGPPGTGKTRTLVEVIRQAVARGERVLATAASNTAVDNVAIRLIDAGVPFVRLGHPARVAPEVERRSLDGLLEESGAFDLARQWHAEAADLARRARAKL
ncbi:MAG TPA: AAA domain-containing protein, partial [bacterium]|nr:AAA domain-containing protein [bacterium]